VKVVLGWLREFCPVDLAASDLAEVLTAIGVKVEDVVRPWAGLDGVIAAQVLEVRDHPHSDTLCLARLSTGATERSVVVGVRNIAAGDIVPYAGPGARVPVLDEPLAERTIRGERSEGMVCSPRELAISDDHAGILVLDRSVEPGSDVAALLGLDDVVLDVEIEPNRPDLMSVIGVAREVATATGVPFSIPAPRIDEAAERAEAAIALEVRDPEACPRYLARVVRGVRSGPSPLEVQARLTAAGMRPLSNVVDATNYVMLERGQPLHAFDLAKLAGPGIVVRRADPGERLTTLDEVERTLTPDDLVIADQSRAVAIAGVLGSAAAEVDAATADLVLESASFRPTGILRTARRLELTTEASARFERGVDPEAVPTGADRAAELISSWAGGSVLGGSAEVGSAPARAQVEVRASRATKVLGMPVDPSTVADALARLVDVGITTEGDHTRVTVPGYRVDLRLEEDLIEEVARIVGYDEVPATVPTIRQAGGVPRAYALRERLRDLGVRAGLHEVRLLSFAAPDDVDDSAEVAVSIANPLSAEEGLLRTQLLPGLVHAATRNAARGVPAIAIFEVGTVFRRGSAGDPPVREGTHLGLLLTGPVDTGWSGPGRQADFFDASGAVEVITAGLGVGPLRFEPRDAPGGRWHPARTADVSAGGELLGIVGELHPRAAESADLSGRVAAAELDAAAIARAIREGFGLREVPRFPPVRRDLAFVVDAGVPAGAVTSAIREAGAELLDRAVLFDLFTGDPIPPGRKSLAFGLEFRAVDRTLTDAEVDEAVASIVADAAHRFGAELRSG
jgi:phenylalanyl-tRNA synthetase beta chain